MTNDRNDLAAPANGPSRRQLFYSFAVTLGGLALGSTKMWAEPEGEISRTAEAIHQEPVIKASRKLVYEALTDTEQFDKVIQLSGAMKSMQNLGSKPTHISREVGGAFTLFGGYVTGRQCRTRPWSAHRAGVASGQLGSGRVFDREIRTGGARLRDQDCL